MDSSTLNSLLTQNTEPKPAKDSGIVKLNKLRLFYI